MTKKSEIPEKIDFHRLQSCALDALTSDTSVRQVDVRHGGNGHKALAARLPGPGGHESLVTIDTSRLHGPSFVTATAVGRNGTDITASAGYTETPPNGQPNPVTPGGTDPETAGRVASKAESVAKAVGKCYSRPNP